MTSNTFKVLEEFMGSMELSDHVISNVAPSVALEDSTPSIDYLGLLPVPDAHILEGSVLRP